MPIINNQTIANEVLDYLDETNQKIVLNNSTFELNNSIYEIQLDGFLSYLNDNNYVKISSLYDNSLIFGKNTTEGIVSVEVDHGQIVMFLNNGSKKTLPHYYWYLTNKRYPNCKELDGNLHYKFIRTFDDKDAFQESLKDLKYKKGGDVYCIYDEVEAAMVINGITLYKGLKIDQVSVLSFDIETTGLVKDHTSKVLIISNSFKKNGITTKRLFALDQYENDVDMIKAWCKYVRSEIDPDIINGHNILGYDLPYLSWCYGKRYDLDNELELGRDSSAIKYDQKPREFRYDGSQSWSYHNARIYGRQIIDGQFTTVHFDFARNYNSFGLKNIIKYELDQATSKPKKELTDMDKRIISLQKDRQFYDASKIKDKWDNIEERKKIIEYCIDDGEDSLFLFDLMIPQYFYFAQSVPLTLQTINNTATGRQVNLFLIRAYLQDGHSIPKADDVRNFGGGISFGKPGIYKNVFKIDLNAMYPSIIRQYDVYDRNKDPKSYFLKMVDYFTLDRLKLKKLGKETGDRYYKELEQSRKIFCNSAFGTLGTSGLNFNSIEWADFITAKGRDIISYTIKWATNKTVEYWFPEYNRVNDKEPEQRPIPPKHDFIIANTDTDSISICKTNQSNITEEERTALLNEINGLFPEKIKFADDGYFKTAIIVKAKNYILDDGKKVKMKGSALKATMKEPALTEFIKTILDYMLNNKTDHIYSLYNDYTKEILNIQDIKRWAMKKTITKAVLQSNDSESGRLNEQKVLDAIKSIEVQEGDKIYLYYDKERNLRLSEVYDGQYDLDTYLEKLYKTLEIFDSIIDIKLFPNYKLKKNKELLTKLL